MFGGTLWTGSIGGFEDHTLKERDPPSRPISLEFPNYQPPFKASKLDARISNAIRDRICHIRSFNEIQDDDLAQLNIKLNRDVPINHLLPKEQFTQRPLLFDDDLDAMLTEISVSNQDAFRESLRMDPLPGRNKPRLAYGRNFFGSLEDMARYWDDSMDHYYHVPVNKAEQRDSSTTVAQPMKGPKELKQVTNLTPTSQNDADIDMLDEESKPTEAIPNTKQVYKGYRFGNGEQLNPGTRVAMVKNLLKMVMHKFACRDHEPVPSPREKLIVRGVKIQSVQYHFCVARVPKDSKLARARMVEGPLMAAHCREEVRFMQDPKVASAQSLLTGDNLLEGSDGAPAPAKPKVGVNGPTFVGEKFDVFREVGCMLIVATQRHREGKTKESFSGADKWWVTKKRWGGGPTKWGDLPTEAFEDEDPSWSPAERKLQEEKRRQAAEDKARGLEGTEAFTSAKLSTDDLMANNAPSLPNVPGEPLSGPRKKKLRSLERPPGKDEELRDGRPLTYVPPFKKKWYADWQKLRPNTPMWDDKLIYKHIGKHAESQFDDIYMITSVNHHVALLHMQVHPDYLAWLEEGKPVSSDVIEDGKRRDVLYVQRSTWYNMFDVEARREILVALWRLMCWLNRENVDQAEYDKMEEKKKGSTVGVEAVLLAVEWPLHAATSQV